MANPTLPATELNRVKAPTGQDAIQFDSPVALPAGSTYDGSAIGSGSGFTAASQAEAEAGTDNTKGMTPLRTEQAIDAQAVCYDEAQTLTQAQRIQARKNIGITPEMAFIVPTMRHYSTGNGEKLGMMVTFDNFATLTDMFSGDLYTDASALGVRDPSLIRYNGTWFICYTRGAWEDPSPTFVIIRSQNLKDWELHAEVTISASRRYTWAPKWFCDPISGKVYITVSFDPSPGDGGHYPYIGTPNADLTEWTWTLASGLPSVFVDFQIASDGKYYYAVGGARTDGSSNNADIYRSTSLTSGWTLLTTPSIGVVSEQFWLTFLGGNRWRFLYIDNPNRIQYMRYSDDGLSTFGTAHALKNIISGDANERSFVQVVDWPSLAGATIGSESATVFARTVTIDDTDSPSGQQLTIAADGGGGFGAFVQYAGSSFLSFDAERIGSSWISRYGDCAAYLQKNATQIQWVAKAVTAGSTWSPASGDVRHIIDLITGGVYLKGASGSISLCPFNSSQPFSDSPWMRLGGGLGKELVIEAGANTDWVHFCYTYGKGILLFEGVNKYSSYLATTANGTVRITSDGASTRGILEAANIDLSNVPTSDPGISGRVFKQRAPGSTGPYTLMISA